jgi:amidohydrolase
MDTVSLDNRRSARRSSQSASAVLEASREILPWLVEIRRDLHRHPELGLEEFRTARRIGEHLDEIGIEHVDGLAGTGVLGLIRGVEEGPTVALRADIDALPLQDAKEVEYGSEIAGRMHACGHDVHTAILLGAGRLLYGFKSTYPGLVKLIFQPAEETVGGAQLLIKEGVLENPPVKAIFGLHVDSEFEVGTFGVRYGQRNASSDSVKLKIRGKSGHAAYPAGSVDAIVIAAQVIQALQTVVSRNLDARDSAAVSFGVIRGGTQSNIIASEVELKGTVRTLDPTIRDLVLRRVQEIATSVAAGLGGSVEIEIEAGYDPLINTDTIVDIVRSNATRLVGEDKVFAIERANMGAEDFGYYLSKAEGAFFTLGAGNEAKGIVHSVHNEKFDVDEECMVYGVAIQVLNSIKVLQS